MPPCGQSYHPLSCPLHSTGWLWGLLKPALAGTQAFPQRSACLSLTNSSNNLFQTKGFWYYVLCMSNLSSSFDTWRDEGWNPYNDEPSIKYPNGTGTLWPSPYSRTSCLMYLTLWRASQNCIYDVIASQGYSDDTLCFHKCQKDSFLKTLTS